MGEVGEIGEKGEVGEVERVVEEWSLDATLAGRLEKFKHLSGSADRPSRLTGGWFYLINQSCSGKSRQVPTNRRILLLLFLLFLLFLSAATASNQRSQASICWSALAVMKHATAAPSTKLRIGFPTRSCASRGRKR
jgi:hypothetical protein